MRKKTSKIIPSDKRRNKEIERKPCTRPADSFFQKASGIFLICVLFFGLAVWTFLPVLQSDFQYFDEYAELRCNTHMNSGMGWQNLRWALFSMEYSNWYPLTWISHMLDFEMYGVNSWGHHLTNVLLHATNGVLLFLVLKRMTGLRPDASTPQAGALWRSLVVAALFALHPLRVESVAWISERKDVLSALFGLLALWTYARFSEESRTQSGKSKLFYGLTLVFFVLGLMSKSMLVTFPCILLLLDFWPLERWRQKGKWNLLMEKIPFFLLALPVSIAAWFAQKEGGQFLLHFPLSFRLETALMDYSRYLGKMFWPSNFSVLYPYPDYWPAWQLFIAAALILGISLLAFFMRRQRPYLLVGWLWYLGTLAPVIGLIPLGAQSMSNRYTYIPMIGIGLLVVWAIHDLSKRWRGRTALMSMVVLLMMGACIARTRAEIVYWKNGETLWNRAIAVTKNNFMAHYCLAITLSQTDPDRALAEYQKSVDIHPDYAGAQLQLGVLLGKSGRYSDAAVHFEKAIQLDPQNGWADYDLGFALMKMNRLSDAVSPLLKAIEDEPQSAMYKDELNNVLFLSGYKTDAISHFLVAVRSDPAGFGRLVEAAQFDTNRVTLINNLAICFAIYPDPDLRNGKYAVRLATRSCEMTGFQTNSYVMTLAAAYAEDSRFDEAVSTAQLACSLVSATGQPELLKRYQNLLDLFRSHQAYHAPVMGTFP